jgi:hypothetical protein
MEDLEAFAKDVTLAREGELRIGLVQEPTVLITSPVKLHQPNETPYAWGPRNEYVTETTSIGFGGSSNASVRMLARIRNRGAAHPGITYSFITELHPVRQAPDSIALGFSCDIVGLENGGSVLRPAFLVANDQGSGQDRIKRLGPQVMTSDIWGSRVADPYALTTLNLSIQFNPGHKKNGKDVWASLVFFIHFYRLPQPELSWS